MPRRKQPHTPGAEPVSEQIYQHLRDLIVVGEIAAGQKIDLEGLGRKFGVSRMPVRDAATRLAAEGLLTVVPRVGTIVSKASAEEVREELAARYVIEPGVVEFVAENASAAFIADLEAIQTEWESIDTWNVYRDVRIHQRYVYLKDRFHLRIVEETGMPKLISMLTPLLSRQVVAPVTFGSSYAAPAFRMSEHRIILAAIARHDGRAAAEAMREHLRLGISDISRHFEKRPDPTKD